MKRFISLFALLLTPIAARSAVTVTNIANFPSVSVAYTNYVSELITTNGVTIGGVRNTAWPTGGSVTNSNTLTNLAPILGAGGTALQATNVVGFRSAIGLGNVDNTSDAAKPVSTATQAALDAKAPFPTQVALTHAGTTTLSFSPFRTEASITLTGNWTVATSGLVATNSYVIFGRNTQATNCTPTFPAWRWMGGAPSTITALKEFVLSLSSRGTVDTNVWAAYSEAQ